MGSTVKLDARKEQAGLHRFTGLPQHLLELILIPNTEKSGKRALRLACKCFQEILDACLISMKWNVEDHLGLTKLLQRAQPKMLYVTPGLVPCSLDTLMKHLPNQLTGLTVDYQFRSASSFKELGRLTCLKALNLLFDDKQDVTGLGYVAGLTRLLVFRPTGSLASLAPTLKQLKMYHLRNVQDLDQLTNLECLEMCDGVPSNFFKAHGQLPLKHLVLDCWKGRCHKLLTDAKEWDAAPKTLKQLTICNYPSNITPGVLPASITCLALFSVCHNTVKKAVAALPGLITLEIEIHALHTSNVNVALKCLSNLTCLTLLRLGTNHNREQVLSSLPIIEKLVETGIRLETYDTSDSSIYFETRWATRYQDGSPGLVIEDTNASSIC